MTDQQRKRPGDQADFTDDEVGLLEHLFDGGDRAGADSQPKQLSDEDIEQAGKELMEYLADGIAKQQKAQKNERFRGNAVHADQG